MVLEKTSDKYVLYENKSSQLRVTVSERLQSGVEIFTSASVYIQKENVELQCDFLIGYQL